jgi:hypothetical protein
MADEQAPKIHIDSDWKAQARAEKEKLAQKAAETDNAKAAATGPGGMPPANFETLISTMATQALFAMGAIPDPRTGQRMAHLDLARHHIDMLTVIEEKSKGNLSEEESKMLAGTLYELRSRYIQLANQSRQR